MQTHLFPKKTVPVIFLALFLSTAVTAQLHWKGPTWRKSWGGGRLDEENARTTVTDNYSNYTDSTLTVDSLFEGRVDRTGLFPRLINKRLIEVTEKLVVDGYESKIFRTLYKADGVTPHSTTETHKNPAGIVIMEETLIYENGKPVRGTKTERNAAGAVIHRYRYDPDNRTFIEIASNNCDPRGEVFAAYSYLKSLQDGAESESFPMGAHVAITYLATQRLGLVADVSFHSKKDQELRITQAFLMGGVQYYLLKQQAQRMRLLARLLAGLAKDKQKYDFGMISNTDKANALALAFGLGLQYELNRRFAIAFLADYIQTRFNKESQSLIRASAGIRINLGCK